AVGVTHAKLRSVGQRRDAHAFSVDVRPVGACQVVKDEESALEDDLGMVPRYLRIAQNDVVPRVTADGEWAVGLEPITLLCPVQADEEQFGHFLRFYLS